jgi:hypothetical protein
MVIAIVMGEIGICLKGEVGQFSSLLPGTVLGQSMHKKIFINLNQV